MIWEYSHKGLSQGKSVGAAVTALGVLMLVFGAWQWYLNRGLAELHVLPVSAARARAMAMPAVFGLAVLIGGVWVMLTAGRRQRIR